MMISSSVAYGATFPAGEGKEIVSLRHGYK